jgi:ATP-binding cassette, subfamily C, bacterial
MNTEEIKELLELDLPKRAKTPTVIQMEAVECGAVSLAIILGYYKRFVPLEELRMACGVSSDGSRASNVLKAARVYGLEAEGYKKSILELAKMKLPAIVFWEFNHFLVVEGFSDKGVFLNDPASGPRRVTYEEFSQKYTGLVLGFEEGPNFEKKGSPPSVVKALTSRIKGLSKPFTYMATLQLFSIIPVLAMAAFTQLFLDKIVLAGNLSWKWGLVLAMSVVLVLQSFFTWAQGKGLYRLNGLLSMRLSSYFIHHILRLPSYFYEQRSSGELAMRVQLNDTVVNDITGQVARSVLNMFFLIFYFFVMLIYSVPIAFLVLFSGFLQVLLLIWINRARTDAMSRLVQNYYQMVGFSVGGLQSMETIKSLGLESDFFSKWSAYYAKWVNANQGFGEQNSILNTLSPFINLLTNASMVLIGGYLVIKG